MWRKTSLPKWSQSNCGLAFVWQGKSNIKTDCKRKQVFTIVGFFWHFREVVQHYIWLMEEEWSSLLWMFKKDNKYVLNNIWMISMIFTTNFDNAVIRRWKLSLMKKEEEAPKQWPSFPNCLPHFISKYPCEF
jgi:hypothetical protein